MILAHPLNQPGGLPWSPFYYGCIGIVILWTVLSWKQGAETEKPVPRAHIFDAWKGALTRVQWVTRAIAIFFLFLSIAAGRLGPEFELDNLAPALVIGLFWPLVVLGAVLFGPLWRWLDPWDGLARLTATDAGEPSSSSDDSVHPAGVTAFAVTWYFYAYPQTLAPRSIGVALIVYTIAVLTGCLVLGRQTFMGRVEAFGIFLGWVGRLRQRGLRGWMPPAGTEIVLGFLIGGPLFYAARLSTLGKPSDELFGSSMKGVIDRINDPTGGTPARTLGLILSAAVVAFLLWLASRLSARKGGSRAAITCAIPVAAFVIFAVGFARSRLPTSLQVLPSVLGDPFGRGWDLFGSWGTPVDPNPFGTTGRIILEAGLVFVGHLIGAFVLRTAVPPPARMGAGIFLSLSLVAGIVAVSAA